MPNFMPKMPAVEEMEEAGFTEKEKSFVSKSTASRGKNKGRLRASKPGKYSAEAQYVWRMVAFMTSPKSQHQCMPVTAGMNLEGSYDERANKRKELDEIVDKIVDLIPKKDWHGVKRWKGLL